MLRSLVICMFFFVVCIYGKECSDCMPCTSCAKAMALAVSRKNPEKFKSAHCGNDGKIPKVCCSDFDEIVNRYDSPSGNTLEKLPKAHNELPQRQPQTQTKECSDCMSFTSCANAMTDARSHKNPEKFKSAHCGYDGKIPKLCCSDFDEPVNRFEVPENNSFENHPNAGLLPASCGGINGDRIVGGKIALLAEFPWMALIAHKTGAGAQFQCGGSVINSRYILTAAHCVKNKQITGVRIGEHDLSKHPDCEGEGELITYCEYNLQDILVEDSIVHENFVAYPVVHNDIALLRLKKPIDFSYRNAGPICLPVTEIMRNEPVSGKNGTVAGWGATESNSGSNELLKVDIPILASSQCQEKYNKGLQPGERDRTENQFCAGTLNKDSCNGDSGGPLMFQTPYNGVNRMVQYGIVSHGPRQCGSDYPGVYTDVTKFMDWILNNMKA